MGFPINDKHASWIMVKKCKGSHPAHLFLVVEDGQQLAGYLKMKSLRV